MLTELHISYFAIIEHLEINFGAGLITFTGETGAGKSIIIDALSAILGSRVDSSMVRANAQMATIEGVFRITQNFAAPLKNILEREDLLDDQQFVMLTREIRAEGRSVARVNGHTVSVGLLREIGELLVDVHGQSEHLSLLQVKKHLDLLDRFANNQGLIARYHAIYKKLKDVQQELDQLQRSEQDAARRADLLAYQINEIESASLQPNEDEALREERNRLANAEQLANLGQAALLHIDEDDSETPSASDLLGQAAHALVSLSKLDPSQNNMAEQSQALLDALTDLTHDLRTYLENVEFNPPRLVQVEERLALIDNLKHKYGDSIDDVLAFAVQAGQELDSITHAEERLEMLKQSENEYLAQLGKEGQRLSENRHAAAKTLSQGIEKELADLRMSGTRFAVDFQTTPDPHGALLANGEKVAFDASGLEKVEFLIEPNPGEGLKPLVKIASGGETSRLMLALKQVLSQADHIPTLIFDEIDQGIGGRIGTVVGRKLWQLSRNHQVLCITHLPQLAAFGEQHFHVRKQVNNQRTTTSVDLLEGENRILELATMLGNVSEGTLRSAHELLQFVNEQS